MNYRTNVDLCKLPGVGKKFGPKQESNFEEQNYFRTFKNWKCLNVRAVVCESRCKCPGKRIRRVGDSGILPHEAARNTTQVCFRVLLLLCNTKCDAKKNNGTHVSQRILTPFWALSLQKSLLVLVPSQCSLITNPHWARRVSWTRDEIPARKRLTATRVG